MARLTTAILCDFAQVRENLLFVSSGGITRLKRDELPAPIAAVLALVMEVGPDELDLAHEVGVTVAHTETATSLGNMTQAIQLNRVPEDLQPGEPLQIPMVVPVGLIQVSSEGAHDIRVTVDAQAPEILTFYVIKV